MQKITILRHFLTLRVMHIIIIIIIIVLQLAMVLLPYQRDHGFVESVNLKNVVLGW